MQTDAPEENAGALGIGGKLHVIDESGLEGLKLHVQVVAVRPWLKDQGIWIIILF